MKTLIWADHLFWFLVKSHEYQNLRVWNAIQCSMLFNILIDWDYQHPFNIFSSMIIIFYHLSSIEDFMSACLSIVPELESAIKELNQNRKLLFQRNPTFDGRIEVIIHFSWKNINLHKNIKNLKHLLQPEILIL